MTDPPTQDRTRGEAGSAFLTHAEVDKLAAECAPPFDLFVLLVAYTGLRPGEAAGLRVGDLDLDRRRLRVETSFVEVAGQLEETTPKSHRSRTVPVPRFLPERLAALAGVAILRTGSSQLRTDDRCGIAISASGLRPCCPAGRVGAADSA